MLYQLFIMKISMQSYDSLWPLYFQKEQQRIAQTQKMLAIKGRLHHIGSTAVVGCYGQGCIDILLQLEPENKLEHCSKLFNKLGYMQVLNSLKVAASGQHFIKIRKSSPTLGTPQHTISSIAKDASPAHVQHLFQVFVLYENSVQCRRNLVLRDHLRQYTSDLLTYNQLKQHLANMDWSDYADYERAKSSFFQQTLIKLGV